MSSHNIFIAPWYDNKKSAIFIAFDDWTPGQIHIAKPVLEEFSLIATFFVCLNNFSMRPDYDHWKILKDLANAGNEIGNHTMTHQDMTLISHAERMDEIYKAQKILSLNLNIGINTFAYPYGNCDEHSIIDVMPGHLAARKSTDKSVNEENFGIVYGYDFSKKEEDYYSIHDFCITNKIALSTIARFIENHKVYGGLAPFVFHGIFNKEYPGDQVLFGSIDEGHFRHIIQLIKNSEETIWITTFKDAILYHRTRANYCLKKLGSEYYSDALARHEYLITPVAQDAEINTKYVALTIVMDIEDGYRCVMVRQAEQDIGYTQQGSRVQFNVKPTTSIIAVKIERIS